MFVDEAEMSSGTVIDKLDSGDRRLGTSIVLTRYNSVACYRIGVQPYFARESLTSCLGLMFLGTSGVRRKGREGPPPDTGVVHAREPGGCRRGRSVLWNCY